MNAIRRYQIAKRGINGALPGDSALPSKCGCGDLHREVRFGIVTAMTSVAAVLVTIVDHLQQRWGERSAETRVDFCGNLGHMHSLSSSYRPGFVEGERLFPINQTRAGSAGMAALNAPSQRRVPGRDAKALANFVRRNPIGPPVTFRVGSICAWNMSALSMLAITILMA
jgi:hypothetical protein